MSRETQEYLGNLSKTDEDQGPQINWTRGFDGDKDQYDNHNNRQSDGNYSNNQRDNNRWDSDQDNDDGNG